VAGRAVILVLLVAWLGAGCRPQRAERQGDAAASPDTAALTPPGVPPAAPVGDTVVRGVVAVVGADPLPEVVVAAGPRGREVAVIGPLRAELGALSGAEVEVRGRSVPNPLGAPPLAVDVASYEIVLIGGEPPIVGTLEARGDEVWLAGRRLVAAPRELRGAVGRKVWAVGRPTEGGVTVLSFGVIR